ncbi:MAG TPA: lysozyme inhibitor LprI family protein [Burkholderiaceae bacterium]|nr:lysozyme inhibitor LprI family protein [Burkholderiaceae bacterium]
MKRNIKHSQFGNHTIAIVMASLMLTSLSVINAHAAPSFDCKKASTPAEKEICASKTLSQLDSAIANAYKQAQKNLAADSTALAELKTSQRLFISTRNIEATPHLSNDYNLQEHMSAQLDVLRGIATQPRVGLEGEWRTSEGKLWVGPVNKNGLRPVNAQSRTHDSKHWSCEFLGEAKQDGETLLVQGRDKYKTDYDNWQLKLTPQGRLLVLSYIRPSNNNQKETYSPPFCSLNGFLVGNYFPSDIPDNPCAGIPVGQCKE